MRILAIGDVTSPGGVAFLKKALWSYREKNKIDLCIVNAENAGLVTGASPEQARELFSAGADCLTGGNHTLRNRSIYSYIDGEERMLRPINYGADAPGSGYTVINIDGYRVLIINAMGNVKIEPVLDSPISYIERVLTREAGRYDIAVLDIHAEATGEKLAIAHEFDGVINIVYGTHTHVPTADLGVLPGGTAYVSDLGMCGESGGILGMEIESVLKTVKNHMPPQLRAAEGAPFADGVIFDIDPSTGKVKEIKRVKVTE